MSTREANYVLQFGRRVVQFARHVLLCVLFVGTESRYSFLRPLFKKTAMFVIPETRFDEMDLDGLSASQTGLDTSNLENVANSSLSADFAAKVNADKVRLLLKANDALKTQVLKIQREQKDNVRVKRIKRLEAELEEKQIVFEAFKERLTSSGCTEADVQALVVKAIGGPARIRPPTVEELQAEIAQLKVDKLRVEKKLKSATTALVQGQTTAPSMATSVELLKSASASVLSASSNNAEHLKFVAVCAERDELKRCVEDQQRQLEEARESSRLQKMYVTYLSEPCRSNSLTSFLSTVTKRSSSVPRPNEPSCKRTPSGFTMS
jgi:chemotaxis protein histidine kinase CheA